MTEQEIRNYYKSNYDVNDNPSFDNTRYSITRVQKRFKDIYDLDVRKIDYGYKGYRYRKYIEYDVFDSDGQRVMHRVTLRALGDCLVRNGDY